LVFLVKPVTEYKARLAKNRPRGGSVLFGRKREYSAESFGHTTNRAKCDSSVEIEKSVGRAKRGAMRNVQSKTVILYAVLMNAELVK
jgi:hypothetical protein